MNATQLDLLQRSWIETSQSELLRLLNRGQEFAADDLHRWLTPPEHVNWWGCLLAKLRSCGRYRPTGEYRKSARPSANGRKVPVWRVVA